MPDKDDKGPNGFKVLHDDFIKRVFGRRSRLPPADFHLEQVAALASTSGDKFERIAERALELVSPLDNVKVRCRQSIKDSMAMIGAVHEKERPRAAINADIEKLYDALRKTKAALKKLFINGSELHLPMNSFDPKEIVQCMKSNTAYQSEWRVFYQFVIDRIALLENRSTASSDSVRWKGGKAKLLAALHSLLLLKRFGRKPPTQTVGGPFYELASLLYEGATGVQNANLERFCRKIFAQHLNFRIEKAVSRSRADERR